MQIQHDCNIPAPEFPSEKEEVMAPIGRYMVFKYDSYYPGGGMNDFVDSTDSLEAVIELATVKPYRDYTEILDVQTGRTYESLYEFLKEQL